ncbi:Cytochrome P460 [uncultured archaeon]|nr:Cytochrome P460 [uncultured archaeon]
MGCIGTKETKSEPKAEGKALYNYITAGNNYKNWNKWPGTGEFYPKSAGSPHGDVNDKALAALTVMYKEKGYDPAHNDWFWYSPTGEVQAEGKVGMCNDCHGKQKDNDYTFTGTLK